MFELNEAADKSGVNQEQIMKFISWEWITPAEPIDLKLDAEDIARIELIWELKYGLGVNDESIPIILHLVDELNHLHLLLKNQT